MFAASSISEENDRWKPTYSVSHTSNSSDIGRKNRSMSVSSNSSVASQSSVFSNSSTGEDPVFARGRSRKNSTQSSKKGSRGSTLASAMVSEPDCVIM